MPANCNTDAARKLRNVGQHESHHIESLVSDQTAAKRAMTSNPIVAAVARRLLPSLSLFCAALGPRVALAGESDMLILPTNVSSAKQCDEADSKNASLRDPSTLHLARHIDALLGDSVQDLDLSLEIAPTTRPADDERKSSMTDEALVAMAVTRWVVSPRLVLDGSKFQLRLLAVAPGSRVIAARTQSIDPSNVDVRAVVMLSELVQSQRRFQPSVSSGETTNPSVQGQPALPARSEGRGILAVSSAILGGLTGYWLQRASGSNDPRVTYPLMGLGAGIGLGASMLAADEWDITTDDAWVLTAGIAWPTASGFLLASGRNVKPREDRYIYGLLGAGTGLTLASTSIALHTSTPGGAVMVHSGGAFGTFLGALTEWTWQGKTDFTPNTGMGAGAGLGVLAAGVLATQVDASSTRVLFVDLAASLGALLAAAGASPLLWVEKGTLPPKNYRGWSVAVGSGTLIGGAVGWWMTRNMVSRGRESQRAVNYVPYFSLTSDPTGNRPTSTTGWVGGLSGTW
jgi:hypothetical protein